jgi:TPR repeat protein
LGVEPHHLQSIPCYVERSRESRGLFPHRNQSLLHRTQGIVDLRRAAKGGHDSAPYLYAISLYRDNGGAAADDTAKGYMRRVADRGSTTSSRWLSNEGCLRLHDKAARALHYSTWRIWGEPLPPLTQVSGDQPCAGTVGGCGMEKGWLRISLFCNKDCSLRCEMVKFAQRIGNQS